MDAQKEVVLGGRIFVATESDDLTFDQFAWLQNATENAGLGSEMIALLQPVLKDALEKEVPLTEEGAENLTRQIVTRCYRQRAHLDVLAGILVEKGKRWTYDNAVANKEFLGEMKGASDIETANVILAQAILGFFWSGLGSMEIFQNSSLMPELIVRLKGESESALEEGSEISGSSSKNSPDGTL